MIELSQVEILGLAFGAITVLAFIHQVYGGGRNDRENRLRDLFAEIVALGDPAEYARNRWGRLKAVRTSRTVRVTAAISDPDPVRRVRRRIRNNFRPRATLN